MSSMLLVWEDPDARLSVGPSVDLCMRETDGGMGMKRVMGRDRSNKKDDERRGKTESEAVRWNNVGKTGA